MALPKLFQRIIWHNNTTPAIQEDNLNAMSKGLSDVDDRVIGLAGTIMEDVPQIQEDMEELEADMALIDTKISSAIAEANRATTAANNAAASATSAGNKALVSEGWAKGTQNGTAVGSSSPYYHNNAEYFKNQARSFTPEGYQDLVDDVDSLKETLTNETSARTSADTLLQTQIDELVAPSGEAPSAAEVQNARIGADGVTYSTLGEAIRGNDGSLRGATTNATNIITNDYDVYLSLLWTSGDVTAPTGAVSPSATFSYVDFIPRNRIDGSQIVLSGTFNFYVYQYDSGKNYLSGKDIIISSNTILTLDDNCAFVRLSVKNAYKSNVAIKQLKLLDPNILDSWKISNDSSWIFERELGDINGNTGQEQANNNFCRSDDYVLCNDILGLNINITDSVNFYLCFYDDNKNFIASFSKNSSFVFYGVIGAKYVRFSTSLANIRDNKITFERPLTIAKKVELVENETYYITFNLMDYVDYGSIDTQGQLVREKTTRCTVKFLRIVPNSYYEITSGNGLYVTEYDENKNHILRNDNVTTNKKYIVKPNTRYLRIETSDSFGATVNITVCSEKKYPIFEYDKYRGYDTIHYYYKVYQSKGTDIPSTDISTTGKTTDGTWTSGVLRLPPNYNPNGDKVPLIYFVHGSGDYHSIYISSTSDMSASYMDYIEYLQDEGFAVFDCFANTILANQSGNGCEWGVPTNIAAARQGIEYCCRNYNIDENSIFVMSKSLGGLVAINMCYEAGINIKACCPLAPELDMACASLGYLINVRKFNAQDLCFSEDVNNVLETPFEAGTKEYTWQQNDDFKNYFRANARRFAGYNPAWRGVIGLDPDDMIELSLVNDRAGYGATLANQNRYCNVPTKIFIAVDDPSVSYDMSAGYIQSLKNCGCVAELRSFPANSGGHHAVDTQGPMVSSITTQLGITHTDVPLAYVELVQFFNRYK